MQFIFNPLNTKHKSITGGVPENEQVRFFVQTDMPVIMRIYSDSEHLDRRMKKTDDGYYLDFELARGVYFYDFRCGKKIFGRGDGLDAKEGGSPFQLTVYPSDYVTPDWIKGGVIYQIFPDRFCKEGDFVVGENKVKREDWGGMPTFRSADGKVRNNEFFGGNFKGIQKKLDYLKELNVNAVYLNPICKSYSSHRYDTGDYMCPDEVLGTIEDFKSLTAEGAKKDIYFIFDGVFNHTGAGSRYFNKYGDYQSIGAYNDKKSPYFDWYRFYEHPDSYACWWDFKTLPMIKKDCQSFQQFIAGDGGVIDFWTDAGIRGIRLDVVDELTDQFVCKIREKLKAKCDGFLVGEVWEDATNKIAYGVRRSYFSGGELDSSMNYPLRGAIIDFVKTGNSDSLINVICEQINNYPKDGLDCLMNVLSTHDSARIITLLGRRHEVKDKDSMANERLDPYELERGIRLQKLASVLQFTLYGVPSVYYGDEEGLEGDLDPYNRRCFDWDNPNMELLNHYKKLSRIRTENAVFKKGETHVIYAERGLFVFSRGKGTRAVVIAVNAGQYTNIIKTEDEVKELFSGKRATKFEVKPYSFIILKRAESRVKKKRKVDLYDL